jgi:UDP-glucose 4-epimerase
MRYLVTGGAGFIGSHLAERLVDTGYDVRVIDNLTTGNRENLKSVLSDIEFIEGDLCDLAVARRVMEGIAVVFHQAALPSVPRSVNDPLATNAANVVGTLNVLVAARDAGVRRVIYASSSSIYGDSPDLPKRETMPPAPKSPYAVSKLAGEFYCRVFHDVYGLETVSLRYFNVFGPRQDPTSQYGAAIPRFIAAYLAGDAPTIFGDGEQTRGFTYVENVVDANLRAAEADGVGGEVFNIASDEQMSINALDKCLRKMLSVPSNLCPHYVPPRAGDVRHSWADISKARQRLGYRVEIDTEEGLRRTVEWFNRQDG